MAASTSTQRERPVGSPQADTPVMQLGTASHHAWDFALTMPGLAKSRKRGTILVTVWAGSWLRGSDDSWTPPRRRGDMVKSGGAAATQHAWVDGFTTLAASLSSPAQVPCARGQNHPCARGSYNHCSVMHKSTERNTKPSLSVINWNWVT